MRLHLPKSLLAAVLAACLAWPAAGTDYVAECSSGLITCGTDGATSGTSLTTPTLVDKITFNVTGGYLFDARTGTEADHTIAANLVIQHLTMDNGFSGGGDTAWYYFTGSVSGSGEILRTNNQNSLGFYFSGDMSEYSGNITISGGGGTPAEGRDYDNILKLGAIQVGKDGAAGTITVNSNAKLQLVGTTIWGDVTSVKTEIGAGNATFKATASLTNVTCETNGSMVNDGTMTLGGNLDITTIVNNGTLSLQNGSTLNLENLTNSIQVTGDLSASGIINVAGDFTLATGDGTVSMGDTLKFIYQGLSHSVSLAADNKTGTINSNYFLIAQDETVDYTTAASGAVDFINVLGTLDGVSDAVISTTPAIIGNGIVSVDRLLENDISALSEFSGTLATQAGIHLGNSNSKLANVSKIQLNENGYITGWSAINFNYTLEFNGGYIMTNGGNWNGAKHLKTDSSIQVYNSATLSGMFSAEAGTTLTVKKSTMSGAGSNQVLTINGAVGKLDGATLQIEDGVIVAVSGRSEGNAQIAGSIVVKGGGTLRLVDADTLGYSTGGGNYTDCITLSGSSGKTATLNLAASQTLSTDLVLEGDATITGSEMNSFGGSITATGTNNTISNNLSVRKALEIEVSGIDDTLKITGDLLTHNETQNTLTKSGAGKLTISGDGNTYTGNVLVTGGELELESTISISKLSISGGTAIISGATTVTGTSSNGVVATSDDTLVTVSDTGDLTNDGFIYSGTTLSGLSGGLSLRNGGSTAGKVAVSGGTLTQIAESSKDIYAALSNVKLINTAGKTTNLYAESTLSGADIGGVLDLRKKAVISGTTSVSGMISVSGGGDGTTFNTLTGNGKITAEGSLSVTDASGFTGSLKNTAGGMSVNKVNALALLESSSAGGIWLQEASSTVTVGEMVLAGTMVGVYSGSGVEATVQTGSLTVSGNSTLYANLELTQNGILRLDSSLAMGSTLTLNSGITLSGSLLTDWTDRMQSLTLFSGVDELILNGSVATVDTEYDASTVFDGMTGYNLVMTGGIDGQDYVVQLVQNAPTPEPTTATLSLLTLMGLAARRRRKS